MSCYYEIIPESTYGIIRNCGKCGCKRIYRSTEKFRVNANGNHLDVWLIYQCEKCKHTYNLPIYERVNKGVLDPKQYALFLCNDKALAFQIGNDRQLLERNHCVIDLENVAYSLKQVGEGVDDKLIITNPYGMKVRIEKLLSQLFKVSRSQLKKMIESEKVSYYLDENKNYVVTHRTRENEEVHKSLQGGSTH